MSTTTMTTNTTRTRHKHQSTAPLPVFLLLTTIALLLLGPSSSPLLSVSASVSCPLGPFTFGPSSTLTVKYSLPTSGSGSVPVIADVTGDAHPEIFYDDNNLGLVAVQFSAGTLSLLWSSSAVTTILSSVAVVKLPSTAFATWMVCAFSYTPEVMCFDAANGNPLFTQALTTVSGFSGVSIERLFTTDPNGNYPAIQPLSFLSTVLMFFLFFLYLFLFFCL